VWLHTLSQDIVERIEEEKKYNNRYAVELKFQYERRLPGNRIGKKSFTLEYYCDNSVKEVFDAAVEEVIENNDYFEDNLPYIVSMNFTVPKFSFGGRGPSFVSGQDVLTGLMHNLVLR
jgi:hypothetical protein